MHTDARNIENNTLIEGDLCIVGAGAAGISMAMEWANTNIEFNKPCSNERSELVLTSLLGTSCATY